MTLSTFRPFRWLPAGSLPRRSRAFAGSTTVLMRATLALTVLLSAGPVMAALTLPGGDLEPEWIDWALLPSDCAPSPGGTVVACGSYGSFNFGTTDGGGCATAVGGEMPPAYVQPAGGPMQPINPVQKSGGASAPCADGSCFDPPGGSSGVEPWVAVIDWNSDHGWTTGWTAKTLSGMPVHLYALDGPDLTASLGPAVGDAHLLSRLCEVAELVDNSHQPGPEVVNMSFGRLVQQGHDPAEGEVCESSKLSCQISQLFEHLEQRGVVATAAAGNYGQVQLPAGYPGVLAAGSLDLARFVIHHESVAAWETPPTSQALLPGYGVCLETADEGLWPAPPGSSYASAAFAGWLAEVLTRVAVPDPMKIAWGLDWSPDAGCFVLSRSLPPVCNPPANRLLARAIGSSADNCWASDLGVALDLHFDATTAQQGVPQQMPSLVEWVEISHAPTPESDPCVPCVSDGFSNSNPFPDKGQGWQLATLGWGSKEITEGPGGKNLNVPPSPQDLVIDVSASSPLRPFLTLEALHLRIDDDYYTVLDRSRPEHLANLTALEDATADSVVIRGARRLIAPDQQPSLLFVLCEGNEGCFWSSVPVLLLE